ncbi:His-Xaa-Ser system radical SAM maturase HxsC [Alcaligenes faecalis]|uniref:His-Xaa-Ser system radical SAM maturase HxsC n=1 Tax=Alcaligenes TaxID=507 RepID=UPI0005AB8F5F|nr:MULTISPECIES: His-Xaa-Ser system radical SAM maturase HxsC [Alcaligenes]ARP52583.1 Radical SAM domain-containing protein [Alcaligenes faecalis]ATH98622.1 His-Xaa-Ser system radical SAM maturase HxsC [Alcaligenes faecalis]AYZ91408.1 His-Xaa-Ser system radical SAM maturase HxsC [Alcaligenes faecalis]MCX5594427.1 His-Xaa-Ser system radical SAM maturase HxsC [Alcaligenes faecalis]MDT0217008.1 His-Xaa-Ser system radical SAM maturase HxsC [Alcaligenes sp. AB3]
MRRVKANFEATELHGVWQVVRCEELASQWRPDLRFMVQVANSVERERVVQFRAAGLENVAWVESEDVMAGDVLVPERHLNRAAILHRPSDKHHGLQLTNRCNSYCMMCSQPPTPQNDDWMVREAVEVIRHMRQSPAVLGLSGGEPLLLGERLREVLDAVAIHHPDTQVEVLTNGRLLADSGLSQALLSDLTPSVTWLVPLYGHADFLHDFVVQAHGAYEQTIEGLLNLQAHSQPVQLRIVLIRPVLENLQELCVFIGRNLPFVREVALMACEPIGFALANREMCEVDLVDWHEILLRATRELRRHSVPFLFMNTPLCTLPRELYGYAHQSISDWKNVYSAECDECDVKPSCSGFFAWHERGWKPSKTIKLLLENVE